jgi:DNA mismatch repair protein MutL
LVRAVPAAIKRKSPMKVLRDIIDELAEGVGTPKLTPAREQIWITSACRMAVKAGDPLSIAEMEKLIVDLASTENPYLCPHGRPITITLFAEDLLRKFKRT